MGELEVEEGEELGGERETRSLEERMKSEGESLEEWIRRRNEGLREEEGSREGEGEEGCDGGKGLIVLKEGMD